MEYCSNCGSKLHDNCNFCSVCGCAVNAKADLNIVIEKRIRLRGTQDSQTEILLSVPQRKKKVSLTVPNNIKVGQSIRLPGEGLSDSYNRTGDLLVIITGIEYLDTELTTSVVLSGAETDVTKIPVYLPHAHKTVWVLIPNNISSNQILRLEGLGIQSERGEVGDLYLHFDHVEHAKEEGPVLVNSEARTQPTYTERKQEYAGKIIKCPACGEDIPSFTAICPSCGHEINSQTTSASVKQFIDEINRIDSAIANESMPNSSGWRTWKTQNKVLWVILNIFTAFIPLVVYMVMPLVKPLLSRVRPPTLSSAENKKASLIENAIFPNEREATIEALMFVKTKMAFLASNRINNKTLYWTELWNTKAEQIFQRAQLLLKDDQTIASTQADIIRSKNKVDRRTRVRAGIGVIIVGTYLVIIGLGSF